MTEHATNYSSGHMTEKPIAEDIRDLLVKLLRGFRVILISTALIMAAVILYIWLTTPLFKSKVEILIDPRQRQTVDGAVAPTGLGNSAAGADTLLLESQVELLRSQKITNALIEAENLMADSEFAGSSSTGLISLLKTAVKYVVYGPQTQLWRDRSAYDNVVLNLSKKVAIERQRNTYVIAVTVESSDPDKSARIANTLADIYIAQSNAQASSITRETADVLTSKLAALRETARQDALKVEEYRRNFGLIDTNQTLLIEQQLSDLNRELTQARSELQTALARRNQVQAAMNSAGSADIGFSELGESAVVTQLQTRLAEVDSQEAELQSVYLPGHPVMQRLRERKTALQTSLRREYARILDRLTVAYRTAQEKEASIESEVTKLEGSMASSNNDTVQLAELEREALASRSIYESFLKRSTEAREQIDIPNSTASIISPAYPASKPSHPNVTLLLVAGMGTGLLFGIFAVLFLDILSTGRHRGPGADIGDTRTAARPMSKSELLQRADRQTGAEANHRNATAEHSPSMLEQIKRPAE